MYALVIIENCPEFLVIVAWNVDHIEYVLRVGLWTLSLPFVAVGAGKHMIGLSMMVM